MKKAKPAKDIDEYIARCPAEVQSILEMVRQSISKAAPDAQGGISYQMPAFKQHGILVYFAAWKLHIGHYPPISRDKAIEKAIARYAGPKGNLLIERIAKLRVKQDTEKATKRMKPQNARRTRRPK